MADFRVIGVDPGPTPGVVVLDLESNGALARVDTAESLQCSAGLVIELVQGLAHDVVDGTRVLLQVERFITRGRLHAPQRLTAEMAVDLLGLHDGAVGRSAAMVKPWATDARLEAAGLLEAVKGMRHARDAARHALFCAVHDAGVPDPLSKEFHR